MIYPFIDEDDLTNSSPDEYAVPREYEINFKTGQLTGRIVEGQEAVIAWAWLAIQTARNRYYIYNVSYGQDFETLIDSGFGRGYIEAEFERMVEECLLYNEYIEAIEDFSFNMDNKGQAVVEFKMITTFGEVNVDVRGNDIQLYSV